MRVIQFNVVINNIHILRYSFRCEYHQNPHYIFLIQEEILLLRIQVSVKKASIEILPVFLDIEAFGFTCISCMYIIVYNVRN